MINLNKNLAIMALLAGTALATGPGYAQDQSGNGAMDQSMSADQAPAAQDQAGGQELLPQDQNQATSGQETTMPDATQQDQAGTDGAQDPATQTEDQATSDGMQNPESRTQDQATSPSKDKQSEDMAQEPTDGADQDQTAGDQQRRQDADQDTATDTRSKKTDDKTASDGDMKAKDKDQAASDKPSNETTASIDISTEQKTVIRNTIIQAKVKPVDIDVKVSVGVSVPRTIELHPLPPKIVEIVPAYSDYVYFVLADGRIVIVEPDTYEVVYVLTG